MEDRPSPAQRQERWPGLGMEPTALLTLTRAVLGQVFIFALLLLPEGAAARGFALGGLGDARHTPAKRGGHHHGPAVTPSPGTAVGLSLRHARATGWLLGQKRLTLQHMNDTFASLSQQ